MAASSYRRGRAALAANAASSAQARRDHARHVAGALVRDHGYQFVVEDARVRDWARVWGRSLAAFSPGLLLSAIDREATAVSALVGIVGGVERASTRATALSQHCLCGRRAAKALAERVHDCSACGLVADRDAMAATLASCVVVHERGLRASASLDTEAARGLLYDARTRMILRETIQGSVKGRRDVPSESNAHSARDGSCVAETGRTPGYAAVARRNVGMAPHSTPNESGHSGQATSERTRTRTNLPGGGAPCWTPLRDSSQNSWLLNRNST